LAAVVSVPAVTAAVADALGLAEEAADGLLEGLVVTAACCSAVEMPLSFGSRINKNNTAMINAVIIHMMIIFFLFNFFICSMLPFIIHTIKSIVL
jgi:hypothetical protein